MKWTIVHVFFVRSLLVAGNSSRVFIINVLSYMCMECLENDTASYQEYYIKFLLRQSVTTFELLQKKVIASSWR